MNRRIPIVLLLLVTSLVGTTFFAQSLFSGKKIQKKVVVDSILKKNNSVEKELTTTDSIFQYQGKFKPFKKSAHASYYADKFHGRRTASGRLYNKTKLTAAHKSLSFGTIVRVTNEANGKSVVVEINDRGPFVRGREIDLSRKAFFTIASSSGMGYIKVTLEILQK
jgi:rare lipoprotein A